VSWGQVVEAVFGAKVEHKLIQPTHVGIAFSANAATRSTAG
jgi:lysyl-tRNA synthetase class II